MSVQTLSKGETAQVPARWRGGVIIPTAPTWTLYDAEENPIQQGVATGGPLWSAEITVPPSMPIENGSATMTVEFVGVDSTGRRLTLVREVEVADVLDEHRPFGLIWRKGDTVLSDTILLDRTPTEIKATLIEGHGEGNAVATVTVPNPTPVTTTSKGQVFEVTVPNLPALGSASGTVNGKWYPFQLVYDITYPGGAREGESKPVYMLTPLGMSRLTSIKRYLDKGNYTDIDPNLTWSDEELLHFLYEGVQYVNASPPEASYWTLETMPPSMDSLVSIASAWIALNARYLAESMSAFEYSSEAVNLQWDRRQGIETKMNELKGTLDNMLERAKRGALAVAGPGNGPRRAIGSLGISWGPMTNTRAWGPYRRG